MILKIKRKKKIAVAHKMYYEFCLQWPGQHTSQQQSLYAEKIIYIVCERQMRGCKPWQALEVGRCAGKRLENILAQEVGQNDILQKNKEEPTERTITVGKKE